MRDRDSALTQDKERTLDNLLAQWTQQQRLSEAKSETIRQSLRQRVLAAEPELSYAWWRRMFRSSTPVIPQQPADFWFRLGFTPVTAGRKT